MGIRRIMSGGGRAVHHRGRRAFRLLYVGHHRIAFGKVVALRAADLPPRCVQIPRAPFERDGHHAVEPVQVVQEVGGRPGRRGQERVENHGLAVQSKMPAFGFQLGVGQSPVQAAAGRPVPRRTAGLVHQLGEEAGAFVCRQDVERRQIGDERTAGIDLLPKARRPRPRSARGSRSLRWESAAASSTSARSASTTADGCGRAPPSRGAGRSTTRQRCRSVGCAIRGTRAASVARGPRPPTSRYRRRGRSPAGGAGRNRAACGSRCLTASGSSD